MNTESVEDLARLKVRCPRTLSLAGTSDFDGGVHNADGIVIL